MVDDVEFIPVRRGGSTSPCAERSGRHPCHCSCTSRANKHFAAKGYRSLHVGPHGVVGPAISYSKNLRRRGIFFVPVKLGAKVNERAPWN
jgi:hypothetical protein